MYETLMAGDKSNTLYLSCQIPDNFAEIEDRLLPESVVHYCGQFTRNLRHLRVDGLVSFSLYVLVNLF
jgi:hypothetical protein